MGGAILRVGGPVHQQDSSGLQLGDAAGVARCHQRDAVIAPVVGQLLAVLQHDGGIGEAGVHCLDGFTQSAQGGFGNYALVLKDERNAAGRVGQRAALAGVQMGLGNGTW